MVKMKCDDCAQAFQSESAGIKLTEELLKSFDEDGSLSG
jgi:hypothetical protein